MSKTCTLILIAAISSVAGCASQVQLPSNVSITPGSNSGLYMDKVDFSFNAMKPVPFDKIKLCVAENISNNAVSLNDTAGSFVGAATGTYYQANNSQSVSGGEVFKYVDDKLATLIAKGTAVATSKSLAVTKDFIRFELKASSSDSNVGLIFSNITRAQQNTGSIANDGFNPVGVWSGARAPDVYATLESVASKIRNCVN